MGGEDGELSMIDNVGRTADFWGRATSIYLGYKLTQARALALRVAGRSDDQLQTSVWDPQQEHAAEQMYDLCVGLRGFYLKVGG